MFVTVNVTGLETAWLPAVSRATAVKTCMPLLMLAVFHATVVRHVRDLPAKILAVQLELHIGDTHVVGRVRRQW